MGDWYRDVVQFHRACGLPVSPKPGMLTEDRQEMRMALIYEETKELEIALAKEDVPEVADALADLIYVAIGMAIEMGIDLNEVWRVVQAANISKASGPKREDGKQLKPEGWKPPNVEAEIAYQGSIVEKY